jgi:hypothetical protein
MAFLICRRAMCPLLKSLADRYTMSDNQPVKAGTGPDSAPPGFADQVFSPTATG